MNHLENGIKLLGGQSLENELNKLRPQIAAAVQKLYDEWTGEDDPEVGEGGICDQVADIISGIIAGGIHDVSVTEGGQPGDDHAWVIAFRNDEAYSVDIPYSLYESGGGYSWKKVPDVIFSEDDIEIDDVSEFLEEFRKEEDYLEG